MTKIPSDNREIATDDYPETESDWLVNLVHSAGTNGLSISRRGVAEPSPAVREALEEGYELDYHHLE